jgi:CheY-like chemotaxis protein
MPGMDGYQVAREIRRHCGHQIFLIALTGYGQPDDVRRALAAGFDAHQLKTVQTSTLNALLSKLARCAAKA